MIETRKPKTQIKVIYHGDIIPTFIQMRWPYIVLSVARTPYPIVRVVQVMHIVLLNTSSYIGSKVIGKTTIRLCRQHFNLNKEKENKIVEEIAILNQKALKINLEIQLSGINMKKMNQRTKIKYCLKITILLRILIITNPQVIMEVLEEVKINLLNFYQKIMKSLSKELLGVINHQVQANKAEEKVGMKTLIKRKDIEKIQVYQKNLQMRKVQKMISQILAQKKRILLKVRMILKEGRLPLLETGKRRTQLLNSQISKYKKR